MEEPAGVDRFQRVGDGDISVGFWKIEFYWCGESGAGTKVVGQNLAKDGKVYFIEAESG